MNSNWITACGAARVLRCGNAVRKEFDVPKLPSAIATVGLDGQDMKESYLLVYTWQMAVADPNQDRKATLAEFTQMYSNQFDGLEENKDGLLTVEEI